MAKIGIHEKVTLGQEVAEMQLYYLSFDAPHPKFKGETVRMTIEIRKAGLPLTGQDIEAAVEQLTCLSKDTKVTNLQLCP